MCVVTRIDRISNEEIRRRVVIQNKLSGRVEKCVPRWFGHEDRMDDEGMGKRVYDSGALGRQGRGRPTRIWMYGGKEALANRGLTLELARETVHDRVEWRSLLNGV